MTSGEFKEFARTMKEFGISRMKMGDVEIIMDQKAEASQAPASRNPVDAPTDATPEIKHKVEALTSLLKLDDTDLVNRLFPDEEEPEQKEEIA